MRAAILCVGKLKEAWQREGCAEYLKRLSRYGKYELMQVNDRPEAEHASPAQIRQVVDKEGLALLQRIRPEDHVVALCIRAQAPDSLELAQKVRGWSALGRRTLFVIGGSNGLSEAVLRRADEQLSFSRLTFPHGLMRVILLEQLYRAESINAGEKYHK